MIEPEFYNVVGCVVNTNICQELDAGFEEAEVEKVLLNLPNGKSLGWDGITDVFKKYACMLKSPFTENVSTMLGFWFHA